MTRPDPTEMAHVDGILDECRKDEPADLRTVAKHLIGLGCDDMFLDRVASMEPVANTFGDGGTLEDDAGR